jgi:hypothetical protein
MLKMKHAYTEKRFTANAPYGNWTLRLAMIPEALFSGPKCHAWRKADIVVTNSVTELPQTAFEVWYWDGDEYVGAYCNQFTDPRAAKRWLKAHPPEGDWKATIVPAARIAEVFGRGDRA